MTTEHSCQSRDNAAQDLAHAVIIPTYNNAATIAAVIGEASCVSSKTSSWSMMARLTRPATIARGCAAKAWCGVRVLALAHNNGKGSALKAGV